MTESEDSSQTRRIGMWWPRIVGEFVIVVSGVLVALGVNSWNGRRLDRIEESEYLNRLSADLREDIASYDFVLDWMDKKEASLRRLAPVLGSSAGSVPDAETFRKDLANATNFGWNVGPLATDATYEDLRSSGKLGLIRDADLRLTVIHHYDQAEATDRRIEARRTEYPLIAYRLIPQARDFAASSHGGSEITDAVDVEELLVNLRASDLPSHVLAETNRALFIRNAVGDLRTETVDLLNRVAAYQVSKD
jgi:hypothetical protein